MIIHIEMVQWTREKFVGRTHMMKKPGKNSWVFNWQ